MPASDLAVVAAGLPSHYIQNEKVGTSGDAKDILGQVVLTADYWMVPLAATLAHSEFSVSGTALDLTSHIPTGTTHMLISVEAASVRWWDDGKTPTSTSGHLLEGATGSANYYWVRISALAQWKCIATAGTASVRVAYYKSTR